VADVKLIGGGEIIERAVTALADDVKSVAPSGVFATARSMAVEISRLTEVAKGVSIKETVASADQQDAAAQQKATTLRHVPGKGLVERGPG
jgi:hypothetical protein